MCVAAATHQCLPHITHIFYSGQNYFERKQTMGELCDRIELGWTCCITCCEVNTGNKRTLVQQKTNS